MNAPMTVKQFIVREFQKDPSVDSMKKYLAAKRALSIASKLPPSQYRGEHVSRIFARMNQFRGALAHNGIAGNLLKLYTKAY